MANEIKYLSYEGLEYFWKNKLKPEIEDDEEVIASALVDLNTRLSTHTHTQYAPTSHTHNYAPTSHSHSNATTSVPGFMSGPDKKKLDGIATGANNYTHPSSHPASMITGLSTVATSGSYNDLSNKPVIANSTAATWYYPTFVIGTSTTTKNINSGYQVYAGNATSTSLGDITLVIGSAATGTVKAQKGYLKIWGESNRTTLYGPKGTANANYTVYLPSEAGTLVVKNDSGTANCDISGSSATTKKVSSLTYSSTDQGRLRPGDIPTNSVVWKMMNMYNPTDTPYYNYINSTSTGYWDCMFMDSYSGTDVAVVTGIGIRKNLNDPSVWIFSGTRGDTTGNWNVRKLIDETGGSLRGNLTPSTTNAYDLGSSSLKWKTVYATTFNGSFTGNITGNVTGNVSGSSGSCTGNAASATNATNASNIYINTTTGSSYYPMTFVTTTSAGNTKLYIGGSTGTTSTGNGIRYNPYAKTCYCSGGFYEASDERLKNFGYDIEVDLDKLSKLSKKYFTWKDDESNTQHIGVSAQEVQELYPELVNTIDDEGHLSVSYDKLSVVALKGIDVLNDKVKSLEERLERLEKLIDNK